ncbi:Rap-GAP domain-containing protein [Meloidogyne graminicola]|uniref:Rap-GAP domain-containing protein n=1 Tax=Meloidogyne graminicola TaxID=189291 RepID=A0A8S9ZYR5_9BILA|nr:Rap-GAP domain-containing protein [Meloidogyne graminicola]
MGCFKLLTFNILIKNNFLINKINFEENISTNDYHQKPSVSFSQVETNQAIKQGSSQVFSQEKNVISSTACTNLENNQNNNINLLGQGEWLPSSIHLCAYHDCNSLANAWGLGLNVSNLHGPTGASQAQSPSEDDAGDGKSNDLLVSCPAFRNELGVEHVRRIALSRHTCRQNTIGKTPKTCEEETLQTRHREHIAAEIGVLEDVSNVYFGGKLCSDRQSKIVIEPQDMGSYYYRHCFVGRIHIEYCGIDESLGPCVVSMVREETKDGSSQHNIYRLILRISDVLTMRVSVPEEALSDAQDRSTRSLMRELLDIVCPQIHFASLRPTTNIQKVEELLLKIDEQPIYTRYKVGILYCKDNQSTEEQMYNNEDSSPNFEEFLDFLGTRVKLKGLDAFKYKGGLDTKGNTTGLYSIYTEHHSAQIMFHVSTMLPFTPNNKQQLARKRHIGNDMVTIIFQEPNALPFSPITVRSHFQHVFIVIRVSNPLTENVSYRVAIARAKDVPAFGPPISSSAVYQKSAHFHDFLITKIINAENAVHRSRKFASMAARTRREALKELVENYAATHHSNEGASRIASRLLGGGSVKRRERIVPRPVLDSGLRGALSWQVEIFDHSMKQRTAAVLGLSADNLVILDVPSGLVIFATPTHSILGWIQIADNGLKIFYDHGDIIRLWCPSPDGSEREIGFLLKRLVAVTNGDEAKEVILRKTKPSESFGFNIQEEGIVTDVDMNASAWRVGLRQGSRVVEIENSALFTYNEQHLADLLNGRTQIKVTMISPGADGNPRRGCEDSNCPSVFAPEQSDEELNKRNQQQLQQKLKKLPSRVSPSSDSWSGPQPPFSSSLYAISERKKFSAPAFGVQQQQQKSVNSIQQIGKASIDFSSRNASLRTLDHCVSEDDQHFMPSLSAVTVQSSKLDDDGIIGLELSNNQLNQIKQPSLEVRSVSPTCFYVGSQLPKRNPLCEAILIPEGPLHEKQKEENQNENLTWKLQKTLEEKKALEIELEHIKTKLSSEQRAHENTRRHLQIIKEYCERFSINPPSFDDEENDEEFFNYPFFFTDFFSPFLQNSSSHNGQHYIFTIQFKNVDHLYEHIINFSWHEFDSVKRKTVRCGKKDIITEEKIRRGAKSSRIFNFYD